MSFSDAMTVLGSPAIVGLYWGSAVLLRGIWLARPMRVVLGRSELAAALATAFAAPFAVAAVLFAMVGIYA